MQQTPSEGRTALTFLNDIENGIEQRSVPPLHDRGGGLAVLFTDKHETIQPAAGTVKRANPPARKPHRWNPRNSRR